MKENQVEVYVNEGKDHINQNSEEYKLKNNDIKEEGGYDKFKNKMKALFKEFEHEETNIIKGKSSSAINFSEKELKLSNGCLILNFGYKLNYNFDLHYINYNFYSSGKYMLFYNSSSRFIYFNCNNITLW